MTIVVLTIEHWTEVNFMQSVLSQQEQKEEQLDIPVADAVMEARREINMCKAYPQDTVKVQMLARIIF